MSSTSSCTTQHRTRWPLDTFTYCVLHLGSDLQPAVVALTSLGMKSMWSSLLPCCRLPLLVCHKQAERLLELPVSGIGPHVQILGDDMAAELQCHVFFVYGQAFSGVGRCPPRLRTEYNAAAAATQDSVASVVGIIDRVLGDVPLRNQLVDATNVAVWRSLGSVPTP